MTRDPHAVAELAEVKLPEVIDTTYYHFDKLNDHDIYAVAELAEAKQ